MKKLVFAVLFAAAGLLAFTACGDDKDSATKTKQNPYEKQIVGTWDVNIWSGTSENESGEKETFYYDNIPGMEFVFKADHTGMETFAFTGDKLTFKYEFGLDEDNQDMFAIIYSEKEVSSCIIDQIDENHLKFGSVLGSRVDLYECTRK